MRYAYPAIFKEENGKILVSVPDLSGCFTFGEDIPDALFMAKDAIETWLWSTENHKETIPTASTLQEVVKALEHGETVSMIFADTDEYRRKVDNKAVKKTLTIPAWLNYQAEEANAPFSKILQEGLKEYLEAKTN